MIERLLNIYNEIFVKMKINETSAFSFVDILQVLLIVLVVVYLYMKFIKGTQAEKLIRGILFFITVTWVFSVVLFALNLEILGKISQYLLIGLLLSLLIVFQPELRKLLVHLGQTKFVAQHLFSFKSTAQNENRAAIAKEITEAVKYCSRVKRGALIVLQ